MPRRTDAEFPHKFKLGERVTLKRPGNSQNFEIVQGVRQRPAVAMYRVRRRRGGTASEPTVSYGLQQIQPRPVRRRYDYQTRSYVYEPERFPVTVIESRNEAELEKL